jgi:23S rRNA (cytosine1962-C5)-methyltransferase
LFPTTFDHPEFPDYALLDSGNGEKLERFGPVTLRRPDPQALWRPRDDPARWSADLSFERESDRGGSWRLGPDAPRAARGPSPEWTMAFEGATFVVRPTPFKHVGLFPEQAANWVWAAERARLLPPGAEILNLFGYTGAASVLAARAGLTVTHVDASKQSVAWARENAQRSGLGERELRVVVDDALSFARREVRRGRRYAGIFVDPPHYGRGPRGEKWQFETGIAPLLEAVRELLAERAWVVLSTYAIGYSPLALYNMVSELEGGRTEVGELALPEDGPGGRRLPCGFCARWWRDG